MHQGLNGALGGSGNRPEPLLRKAQKAGFRRMHWRLGRFRNAFPAKTVKQMANCYERFVSLQAEK